MKTADRSTGAIKKKKKKKKKNSYKQKKSKQAVGHAASSNRIDLILSYPMGSRIARRKKEKKKKRSPRTAAPRDRTIDPAFRNPSDGPSVASPHVLFAHRSCIGDRKKVATVKLRRPHVCQIFVPGRWVPKFISSSFSVVVVLLSLAPGA